jgi:hypothetical protein
MTILSKVTLANANSAQTVLYFFFLMMLTRCILMPENFSEVEKAAKCT